MASSNQPPTYRTHVPLPFDSGGNDAPVPIHIVTDCAQLPEEFLKPSRETRLVVGFDCKDAIYLVDALKGRKALIACKPALESSHVIKVVHDCKRDSEALYFQFGIKLHNVIDTQIAYSLIKDQEGQRRRPDDYISFVDLLADPHYCGISYQENKEVRHLLKKNPKFWTHRPFSELMIHAAADDVRFLPYVYYKMTKKLNERSLWHLAVRGALYCRCFCVKNNDYDDWPSLPPIPAYLDSEGTPTQQQPLQHKTCIT